jgi:predicted phosphodiesterase
MESRQALSGSLRFRPRHALRVAVLSDLHFPFADPAALRLALDVAGHFAPELVILNGDVVDFHGISRFSRIPERRAGFRREVEVDRELLRLLLDRLGPAPVIWLEGNHEYRMELYLMSRSPELFGLDALEVPRLMAAADRVTYVRRVTVPVSRHERVAPEVDFGSLVVAHGDMFRAGPHTVQVARNLYLRLQVSMLIGHWHRNDVWEQTAYDGSVRGFWVAGCLCLPRPEYDAGRHWGQGMALVDLYPDGLFQVQVVRFFPENGRLVAVVNGRRFEARIKKVMPAGLDEVWTRGRAPEVL